MRKTYQITADGKKELQAELKGLVAQRGEIAEKIAEARDFGDLSENAEYDAARDHQGIVETRIAEIENILKNAEIIADRGNHEVQLGSKVELKTAKASTIYTVVSPVEANPLEGKISDESPLGVALLGKKIGETAVIKTPKGELGYTIVSIN